VDVHDDRRVLVPGDVVEADGGAVLANPSQRRSGRAEVGFQRDLLRDAEQLVLLLQKGEELA
jgi:hypothetical protein